MRRSPGSWHLRIRRRIERQDNPRPQMLGQYLTNAWHHLGTVSRHKWLVFEACARCGIPWRGLVHDTSKFSPDEFLVGINYYQTRSPNAAERHDRVFARMDSTRGAQQASLRILARRIRRRRWHAVWLPIPRAYMVRNAFCDRIAASKVYEKEHYTDASPLEYYKRELSSGAASDHPDSAAFFTRSCSNTLPNMARLKRCTTFVRTSSSRASCMRPA